MTRMTLLAAAAISIAWCQPALADNDHAMTVQVPTVGYDLHTAAGRAALTAQVDRAVDAVCGKVSAPQEERKHEAFSCRRDTLPQTRAQLIRLFNARGNVTVERAGGR